MNALQPLLAYLDDEQPATAHTWQRWQITPIGGGANNLLYRATDATNSRADYAVKFTVRDERQRAQREYDALTALQQAGLAIAPQAVWLDQTSYRQPVVVQTWQTGSTLTGPPTTTAEWQLLLDHYGTIHTVTLEQIKLPLADAALTVASGEAGKTLIQREVAKVPLAEHNAAFRHLIDWLVCWQPPVWDPPQRTLCRVDGNWRNFIYHANTLASVDWENSGWGDPAFEMADLITHPAYASVPTDRWQWGIKHYAAQQQTPEAAQRIATYVTIMRIWWVARIARALYEVPRGLDQRLVARPANWQVQTETQLSQYLALAQQAIENGNCT